MFLFVPPLVSKFFYWLSILGWSFFGFVSKFNIVQNFFLVICSVYLFSFLFALIFGRKINKERGETRIKRAFVNASSDLYRLFNAISVYIFGFVVFWCGFVVYHTVEFQIKAGAVYANHELVVFLSWALFLSLLIGYLVEKLFRIFCIYPFYLLRSSVNQENFKWKIARTAFACLVYSVPYLFYLAVRFNYINIAYWLPPYSI